MKIPMGENEKSKYDSVFEEQKSAFIRTESTKSEEKEILLVDKDEKNGEKWEVETGISGKTLVKGDDKAGSKSKRHIRVTMMRRSLSEVNFFALSYFLGLSRCWCYSSIFSSPEPKAHRWAYSIGRHPSSVFRFPSVSIFKWHLLWSHEADSYHISHIIASIGRGNK